MNITQEHMEWAVVDRLGKLLDRPDQKWNVTDTLSSFSLLLCWIIQRIRDENHKSHGLSRALEREFIDDIPWCITTDRANNEINKFKLIDKPEGDIDPYSAYRFLVGLRNGIAHGDDRNITPIGHRNMLVGFSIRLSEKRNRDTTLWSGQCNLLQKDMRRIGLHLRHKFLTFVDPEGSLRKEAELGVVEREGAA